MDDLGGPPLFLGFHPFCFRGNTWDATIGFLWPKSFIVVMTVSCEFLPKCQPLMEAGNGKHKVNGRCVDLQQHHGGSLKLWIHVVLMESEYLYIYIDDKYIDDKRQKIYR